jgi:hypothetical protein
VLLAVNMQTSFMHPPFGFALFYLRSVAAREDYVDKPTGRTIAKVTTGQIYWGAVPFVCIQMIMVGLVIAFPTLVVGDLDKRKKIDIDSIKIEIPSGTEYKSYDPMKGLAPPKPAGDAPAPDNKAGASSQAPAQAEDPMKAIMRSLESDKKK